MHSNRIRRLTRAVPLAAAVALVVGACGSDDADSSAQQAAADNPVAVAPGTQDAPVPTDAAAAEAPAAEAPAAAAPAAKPAKTAKAPKATKDGPTAAKAAVASKKAAAAPDVSAADTSVYEAKNGATDVGVTRESIKLGSINMHGMALGNLITAPQVRGNLATIMAVNDRGGVLGRRLSIVDCDDGPGEVARAKSCIKKLVTQDKIFSLVSGVDWATASIHEDLRQYKLPYVGTWAYSQTEWQDPYMFPTHMSMIHEAMAGAHWVKNVIQPKTYGLICLTSPEMQLACSEVRKIIDATGAKMVKKADVSISETSMSTHVLSMRAAAPDHIVHYVINAATMTKFMIEAGQQNYYPPKGISGNHLASEALGSLFGKHPAGRYWTNTTYKLWGPEFISTMNKYARGNAGANHHSVQAGYVGINIFAQAARQVGPNLTRERLMSTLANGTVWKSDASLDQRFGYMRSERMGEDWNKNYGQGREFMYLYQSPNTVSNPDGSPNGWVPDPDQFVIHTWK